MASFYGGDYVGAVVADIGSYATKVGWAGSDYPRSYFRSNVAILREQGDDDGKRRSIQKVNYDYYTQSVLPDHNDGDYHVANPVDDATGLWYDRDTANGNNASDWYELLQIFLKHAYRTALHVDLNAHPIMLTERSYTPPPIRQQLLECLFEELNVPATFLAKDAALQCYGCGRVTGTVVDLGYSGTTVTPVYEGYVEAKGIRRAPVGVKYMDDLILNQLDRLVGRPVLPLYQVRRPTPRRDEFHVAARLHLALACREQGAGAAINTSNIANFHAPHRSFELPDGTVVDVPSTTRFAVANLLVGRDDASLQKREEILHTMQKDLNQMIQEASMEVEDSAAGSDTYSEAAAVGISKRRTKRDPPGHARVPFSNRGLQKACVPYLQTLSEQLPASPVASMVCDAAYRCDRDQQGALLGNVIVGGGGACLGPTDQAVPDLLRDQVESIIHTHTPGWRVKVLTPMIQERSILSWLGGSILASMGTFHDMWISKAEYDEWGSAIVNRKCP